MNLLGPILSGSRVLVTAQRRAEDLAAALVRRGAEVVIASTLGVEPRINEEALVDGTESLIRRPPAVVVITTGIGFRGWLETAEAAGLSAPLIEVLRESRVIARGPKAVGALQSVGVTPDWVAESETSKEILDLLTREGVAGVPIAVQLHGAGDDGLSDGLRAAGADVRELAIYRWGPPPDPAAVTQSVIDVRAGRYDAVAFTSAPAATAWLREVTDQKALDQIRERAQRDLLLAAVGPVTVEPLHAAGLTAEVPDRGRLGSLVRLIVTRLGLESPIVTTAAGTLRIRAGEATLDHRRLALSAGGFAVLRLLASQPGAVFTREQVLAALPGESSDPHTAEVAVARLRDALGNPQLIKTVFRRGYRIVTMTPVPADESEDA
ncbi:MAG TPA: uroporphyrinogen-III synthase [Propionicimonas sp.]